MIRPSYALKLARTKLQSKRGVLVTSVIVASLLFAALITTVIVFTGAERSASQFIKRAGNDRYLVSATPVIPDEVSLYINSFSSERVREIQDFEKQYYAELRQKHEAAGIEYDASQEIAALRPDQFKPTTLPEEQRVSFNPQSPVLAALREKKFNDYAKAAPNSYEKLQILGSRYNATGYHLASGASTMPSLPQSRIIIDGKEDFSVTEQRRDGFTPYDSFIYAAYNSTYQFADDALLERYILEKDASKIKGVPVIITAQEAARLFGEEYGIGKEPDDPTAKRLWFAQIQEKIRGKTYDVCTRSTAELGMLEKIQRDYAEIKSNVDNEAYTEPSLQYDYPETACGDIIVKKDTRTREEKTAEEKSIEAQKKLDIYEAPEHQMTTFQIVGFVLARPFSDRAASAESYIQDLLSPQVVIFSAQIPQQMYDAVSGRHRLPSLSHQFTFAGTEEARLQMATRVIEFATIDDARNFMQNETCPGGETECQKLYTSDPYGSNYLILDEIGTLFGRIATIAFPIVLGLAAIIIWFTISRIMAENRKETAVYRAMGAKRRDVTAIYLVYVLLVALRIAIVSLVLGVGAAFVIDYFYGQVLTDTAVTAFGIIDGAPRFSLFDLSSPLLWVVIGSVVVISLIASIQPLVRNVRRSPIRDMREGE